MALNWAGNYLIADYTNNSISVSCSIELDSLIAQALQIAATCYVTCLRGQRVQYIHHWIAPILQDIGIICVLWTCIFLHRDSSNIQQVPIQPVQLLPNQGSPNKGYIIILLALIVGSNSHPTWLHQGFLVASCTCLISSNTKLLHYLPTEQELNVSWHPDSLVLPRRVNKSEYLCNCSVAVQISGQIV